MRQRLEKLYERAEDEDEIALLESALDNLAFNEDTQLIPMFEFPDEVEQDDEVELDSDDLDDFDEADEEESSY